MPWKYWTWTTTILLPTKKAWLYRWRTNSQSNNWNHWSVSSFWYGRPTLTEWLVNVVTSSRVAMKIVWKKMMTTIASWYQAIFLSIKFLYISPAQQSERSRCRNLHFNSCDIIPWAGGSCCQCYGENCGWQHEVQLLLRKTGASFQHVMQVETEFILASMIARDFRPDTYSFASVLITYQRTPNDKLDATLAADDAVARGMESLHLQGK